MVRTEHRKAHIILHTSSALVLLPRIPGRVVVVVAAFPFCLRTGDRKSEGHEDLGSEDFRCQVERRVPDETDPRYGPLVMTACFCSQKEGTVLSGCVLGPALGEAELQAYLN